MEFELKTRDNDVMYQIPEIRFPSYEQYRNQALALSDYVRSMEVTAENVKEVKKVLADTRKVTDRLNRKRIDIKKDILRDYEVFEKQIKDITAIIDEADQELRGKVRELDDMEREEKKRAIWELWEKRVQQYDRIDKYIPSPFEKWMQPVFLNKTTSMKTVEASMAEWMKEVDKSLEVAAGMGHEYLVEYISTGDLIEAINNVNRRETIAEHIENNKDDFDSEPIETFIVTGEKDIALTEMLLKTNNINYRTGD